MILIEAEIVVIETEINVKAPIPVVIGYRGVGEGSLRRPLKLKGIAFD